MSGKFSDDKEYNDEGVIDSTQSKSSKTKVHSKPLPKRRKRKKLSNSTSNPTRRRPKPLPKRKFVEKKIESSEDEDNNGENFTLSSSSGNESSTSSEDESEEDSEEEGEEEEEGEGEEEYEEDGESDIDIDFDFEDTPEDKVMDKLLVIESKNFRQSIRNLKIPKNFIPPEQQPTDKTNKKNELKRKPRTTHVITVPVDSLTSRNNPVEYVCPQFEVEKFNPHTKMKLLKRERLFEVNLIDKRFSNLKRTDFSERKSYNFSDLEDFEMFQTKTGENVLGLTFKGKKLARRLIFSSKLQMWRFNEMCKMSIPGNVVWIPELVKRGDFNIKKVELEGKVPYKVNKEGRILTVQKDVKGAEFLAGSLCDKVMLYCVTWCFGDRELPEPETLNSELLTKLIRPGADVYAVSFQLKKQFAPDEKILDDFFEALGYTRVSCGMAMSSQEVCCLWLFVKNQGSKTTRITKPEVSRKTYKNLSFGCVTIRVFVNESPVCFVSTTKLPRDFEKKEVSYRHILDESLTGSAHHLVLMGYLGYFVALPPTVALSFIANKKKSIGRVVLEFDQLAIHKEKRGALKNFKEGNIKFLPTYPIEKNKKYYQYLEEEEKEEKKEEKEVMVVSDCWRFRDGRELAYSGRILVRSLQGIDSNIQTYRSSDHVVSSSRVLFSPHRPVYSVMTLDTHRCHISHFGPPLRRKKVIRLMGVYVGGHASSEQLQLMKDPQLRIEGEWMETSVLYTSRMRGVPVRNPKFSRDEIPIIKVVKHSAEFLSSQYLKIVLFDKTVQGPQSIRGTSIVHMKTLIGEDDDADIDPEGKKKKTKGVWFAGPLVLGSVFVGDLIGFMVVTTKGAGEEEREGEEEEMEEDILDGFEGF